MKLNNYSLLFLNLFLKTNFNWLVKKSFNFKFSIKSFYKNEEKNIIFFLEKLIKNVLLHSSNNIHEYIYIYKFLSYVLIKKNLINKNINKIYNTSYNIDYNYNNNYINKKEIIKNEKKDFNFLLISLVYFYFIYFFYFFILKFQIGLVIKNSKLPNKISKITLLRSPHIDKKSREQFEIIRHKSITYLLNIFNNNIFNIIKNKNNNSYIEFYNTI
jgi:hypothetical protein